MKDPGIQEALRALEPDEIDAIERFVARLRDEGLIRPDAAERWQIALDRALRGCPPLRRLQG
jgi:hypothetical protein